MENKTILVIGGLGYVGRPIVERLLRLGYLVTVISRNPQKHISFLNGLYHFTQSKKLIVLEGNILDDSFLKNLHFGTFGYVIYLAAIVRSFHKQKYEENVRAVKKLLSFLEKHKRIRLLYFSTQSVYLQKTGAYGSSKQKCDLLVRNSSCKYMILRPNYVYGIDTDNDFYSMFLFMKKTHLFVFPSLKDSFFEPINKEDIASYTCFCIKNFLNKKIIDLSGSTRISYLKIARFFVQQAGITCLTIRFPTFLLFPFASFLPFDVYGFLTEDVIHKNKDVYEGSSDLYDDLSEMITPFKSNSGKSKQLTI